MKKNALQIVTYTKKLFFIYCAKVPATIIVLLVITPAVFGQLMIDEDFDGTTADQTLAGQNSWVRYDHTLATDMDIFVRNTTPMVFATYNSGGGNYIQPVTPNTETDDRFRKSNTSFVITSNTTFYLSFLLRVSNSGDGTQTPDHIIAPGNRAGSQVFEFFRVEVKDAGAGFNIGITEGQGGIAIGGEGIGSSFGSTVLNFNQTYLILARYDFTLPGSTENTDAMYVWVDPTISSEPSTGTAEASIAAGSGGNDILFKNDTVDFLYLNYAETNHAEYELDGIRYARGASSSTAWTNLDAYDPLAVPVELTSFSALIKDNSIELHWETATEVNNYGFEIERQLSENGTQNAEWENIGFVLGHGYSNSPKSYEFIDHDPPAGNLQYRLKQIDTDGTFEYFGITADVNISITGLQENLSAARLPSEFNLEQNYPNPFNPETKVRYSLPSESRINIAVYNTLGQQIHLLTNKVQSAGTHELNFDASGLTSGIYIYKMIAEATDGSNTFSKINKMMIVK